MVTVTVDEVVAAAAVLEKMSKIYGIPEPHLGEWCASDLRGEITYVEDLEQQARIRRKIAVEVEEKIFAGLDVLDAVTTVLAGYEVAPNEET